MITLATQLLQTLLPFLQLATQATESITTERKLVLQPLVDYVLSRASGQQSIRLNFICTHNSRRSHLGQIWAQVAATVYQIPNVSTFSGGTQATACNIRTVHALRRTGLSVVDSTSFLDHSLADNPIYWVQYSPSLPPLPVFSKVYSATENPASQFAAVMCCGDAEQKCPVVHGSDARISLIYRDPKVSDDTDLEAQCYDQRCLQIASEMLWVMQQVSPVDVA